MPNYLTPEEAAQELATRGITDSARTVRKWCKQGHFPGAFQAGDRYWLIPPSDIEACQGPPEHAERSDKGKPNWKRGKRQK